MKQFAFLSVMAAALLSMVLLAQTVSAASRVPAPALQTTATANTTIAATADATAAATALATTAATTAATSLATAVATTTAVATATTTPGSLPSTGGDSGMSTIMLGAAALFIIMAGAAMVLARQENSR